jgi:hypothetical protein
MFRVNSPYEMKPAAGKVWQLLIDHHCFGTLGCLNRFPADVWSQFYETVSAKIQTKNLNFTSL